MKSKPESKILVITNMYPSEKAMSFGIFIKNQVEELRSRGFYVDVVGIKDYRMGIFFAIKKYLVWCIKIFAKILKREKYDIIHCHYIFPSGLFGMIFKKLYGSKLVVTAHGGDIDKMARKNEYTFNKTKEILENADQVIAVGEKLKKDIITIFGIDENKISINNMGVNRRIFTPIPKKEAKSKVNLSDENKHLLFVGNLIKAKGLEELIDAYKLLKNKYSNIHLHLIGANKEPGFLSGLMEKIQKENITDIHFYPPMDQKQLAIWLSAADVLVFPSHMEGFGLAALEAMSCHTPVVGSNVGGLSYLLSDGAGVLVEPNNVESLKKGIESVLNDPRLCNYLVTNGEMKAMSYSLDKQVDMLIEIYKKI